MATSANIPSTPAAARTLSCCVLVLALAGCSDSSSRQAGQLSGVVRSDGSSTVFLLTEAVAEEFGHEHPRVRVSVGTSGTGGGFKKLAAGEIDVCNASRVIRDSERDACLDAGIDPIELKVAYDGLSVVVNPKNDWVKTLTAEQLREIWRPDSGIKKWRDLNPAWPDHDINLFGPGTDSGTFDYFTEAICGQVGASRSDYTASEDDNTLVTGVERDLHALGYFGFAYYTQNRDHLKLVPIDGGQGPVAPSPATIRDGSYRPLSRPLLIYVKKASLERPEIAAFVQFFLDSAATLSEEVGYVPLSDAALAEQQSILRQQLPGESASAPPSAEGAVPDSPAN